MKTSQLIFWALITVFLSLGTVFAFCTLDDKFISHLEFYLTAMLIFFCITVIFVIAGLRTTAHKNKSLFTGVSFTSMLVKMGVVLFYIYYYFNSHSVDNQWIILPFFLIYVYFTVFETYALIQIGKSPFLK